MLWPELYRREDTIILVPLSASISKFLLIESFIKGNAITSENEEYPHQGNILEDYMTATATISLASGRQVLESVIFKLHGNVLVNVKATWQV